MKLLKYFELCAAIVFLSACGDTDSLGRGSDGVGSGSPPSGGKSVGAPDEVTLRMDPFVLQPGAEVFMCQTFANPFSGTDVHLREFETHMSAGSHHLTVNYVRGALARDSAAAPCTGLEAPVGPFTTNNPNDIFTYQQGVAALLEGSEGLRLITHYFNVGNAPLSGNVSVTVRRAQPQTVQKLAWIQALSNLDIDVPPHQTQTVTDGMRLADGLEYDLLYLFPHMHSRATNFRVTAGPSGNLIYETNQWDGPWRKLDPPYQLHGGESLNYSCTFFNDTADTLTFGGSASTAEMCALVFHYAASGSTP